MGLVTRVVPKESIESAVMEMAAQVAANAPLTIRATKEMARRLMQARGPAHDDADLIEMCYMSADFKEGVDAFLSKRKPRWTGA
jgi:enoyl-CoA hydratase/carnithine racemase